ncbi:MAG: AzlC family ABC transporter permease [Deltaproteobacteria bacterium]|nr:AzlC family ABC transporter permease [Deltaproteobacteria bacterium]
MNSGVSEKDRDAPSVPFRRALTDATPIILGYIPMGAAYGIIARQSGMGLFAAVFMSLVVFAGASQFIAVGLLAGGATPFEVVLTTFFVNLRHVLMSASLSPYFTKVRRLVIPLIAWGVTDETFAISIGRFQRKEADCRYSLALNYIAYASWVTGTVAGAYAGYLVPGVLQNSLGFALYSMFVGLLVLQISDRLQLVVAVGAAALSVFFSTFMGGTWHIITASIVAATVGLVLETVGGGVAELN